MRARIRAVTLVALVGILTVSGLTTANADGTEQNISYVGSSVATAAIDGKNDVTPENSIRLSNEEVRNAISLEEFALAGKSLGEIKNFYPEATAKEVATIREEHASQPQLRITNPICNNADYYSIVRAGDDREYCFANQGTMAFYMPGIYKVCPGNNNGHVYYSSRGVYYVSPDRGPVMPRTTCFKFSANVEVWNVTIN